jgi:arylsulfatase A-like enzyme
MSMMTSQYPHVHGVETGKQALRESTKTLAEVLSGAGYYTSAFISWTYVSKRYGFGQGFDEFSELLPSENHIDESSKWSYKAGVVTDIVQSWVAEKPEEPFFLFVHYFDPHFNYEPPAPYNKMFDPHYKGEAKGTYEWLSHYIKGLHREPSIINPRDLYYITALYDGEIRYTDTHLGRLLEAIETMVGLDNCLVILVGDHGEELNEHGSMEGHQWTLYDEVVHVPLIFRFPNKEHGGIVVDGPVGLIDVAPTILDWLGIAKPAGFQGRTVMDLIEGRKKDGTRQMLFAETRRYTIKQSIRTERYKLIHTDAVEIGKDGLPMAAGYEMYDMKESPLEQKNIYDSSLWIVKLLTAKLESWRSSGVEKDKEKQPEVRLSSEEIKRLRSLGYVD